MELVDRFIEWMNVQPVIGVLMCTTAIVLFSVAFTKRTEATPSLWSWLRKIIESGVGATLFLGLLLAFRLILNDNVKSFYATHGSLSDLSRESAQSIWGRPHVQRELSVTHHIERRVQEELPRNDPTQPPLYKEVTVTEVIPQNSIIGFVGQVTMQLSEREKGYALYSGYLLDARFEYAVINDSDLETEAAFDFPLSPQQTLFENFKITLNDEDISSRLRFSPDLVQWVYPMKPHQQIKVIVTYGSRGMDTFYYQIPVQREIKNFTLVVSIDHLPVTLLNYPDGVLTPSEIEPTSDNLGSILTWKLDHAVTTAGMGVALLPPEQPGADVLRVLVNSPYGLTLLGAMLALTLLILGEPVQFIDLGLLAGVYCAQFLLMAAVSDYALGFWGALAAGAGVTGLLTFLLFRKRPSRLLQILVYCLVAFFTLVYPLGGLFTSLTQQNTFENLVQVGLIVYLFGLSLYAQAQRSRTASMTAN